MTQSNRVTHEMHATNPTKFLVLIGVDWRSLVLIGPKFIFDVPQRNLGNPFYFGLLAPYFSLNLCS